MKERPILYSAPMVRAKLAGIKTMTRRICKPQPIGVGSLGKRRIYRDEDFKRAWESIPGIRECEQDRDCPYGQPGDRLWVREAHALDGTRVFHRADHAEAEGAGPRVDIRWRSSIHMPRWASRMLDELVSVRVERLQDISRADALAEGLDFVPDGAAAHGIKGLAKSWSNDPRKSYRALWESINGDGSWAANPYVWVIETKPVTP